MDMDFNPALTGSYVAGESTLQADPGVVLLDRSSEWKGLVGFMSRVPAGSVIEVASLSVYQSWVTTDYNDPNHAGSTVDPYRYGKLRVAGCNYEINGPKNCPISAQDAIICSNRGYMTCTGDVTEAVRRGQFRFALGFAETSTTQGILWFDDPALQRPSLSVTWLQH